VTERRFPPPWTVEDIGGSFVVKAARRDADTVPLPDDLL